MSLSCSTSAQADGKHEHALKHAKKVLKEVEKWSDDDVPNRPEVVANLHSCIGNSYLEMGEYQKALDHHTVDQEISNQKYTHIFSLSSMIDDSLFYFAFIVACPCSRPEPRSSAILRSVPLIESGS